MAVIRNRNNNTMTESEVHSLVVSALRGASRWWKPKAVCIARARVGKGLYKCEECGAIVNASYPPPVGKKRRIKGIQADHRMSCVPTTGWDSYDCFIQRMFVEAESYQAICYKCHATKTKEENAQRRLYSSKNL